KKFVVIGPESTGKSTLCSQLAKHYHTIWVREYAREYLEKNGMDYTYDDLLTIAKGQIDLEEAGIRYQISAVSHQPSAISFGLPQLTAHSSQLTTHSSGLLFIDTDMYVMKVWCEYVFNKCHNWILNRIADRKYDGYLLCNADLPWVIDNLREYPDVETRNRLLHFYRDLMVNQSAPWIDISGNYEERLGKAIDFIEKEVDK
ncbi:MAG: ATP-binding protein, partial [Ginsengibacter sp.]